MVQPIRCTSYAHCILEIHKVRENKKVVQEMCLWYSSLVQQMLSNKRNKLFYLEKCRHTKTKVTLRILQGYQKEKCGKLVREKSGLKESDNYSPEERSVGNAALRPAWFSGVSATWSGSDHI